MDGDGNINYEEFVTMLFKVKIQTNLYNFYILTISLSHTLFNSTF